MTLERAIVCEAVSGSIDAGILVYFGVDWVAMRALAG